MPKFRFLAFASLALAAMAGVSCSSSAPYGSARFGGQFGRPRYTSPIEHTENTIAGRKITIDYYAPSMHGRKVFGGLVPYDTVWCTGANYATKITSDADLQMGTLKVPKGSHSIWTVPGEKAWTLIINNQTGQFHLDYDETADLGRTKMELKALDTPVETFRIALRSDGGNKGTLALDWEKTEAYIPFTVSQ